VWAELAGAVFLVLAAAFAFIRAWQGGELDFGWLAIGCLITAVWLIPHLLVVGRLAATP